MKQNPDIAEARALLGEKYDYIPDKSIELIVRCFDVIAKKVMENVEKESE